MPPLDRARRWSILCFLLFGMGALPAVGVVASIERQRTDVHRPVAPSTVSVAIGGDVLLGEDINTLFAREGADAPLAGVPELRRADMALVNLEGIVAPGGDAIDTGRVGDYYFLGRPESLAVLEAAGIDIVATANNHALDFGEVGLLGQDRLLDEMGLTHPGVGVTRAEACRPAFLTVKGLRIAVFSVDTTTPASGAGGGRAGTCYLPHVDRDGWHGDLATAIAEAHATAHVVLVMAHVRASFRTDPDTKDRRLARDLIDLGADAVLGVGAHALQGIEVYAGRPILHNAGTLLFNFPEPDVAALFLLEVGAAGVTAVRTVPLVTEHAFTRPADATESARILADLDSRSSEFGTSISGGVLTLSPPARELPPSQPDVVATMDPGPAPGPVKVPPAACQTASVPAEARLDPIALGPLTLVGARTERTQLDGPALIWLETFWQTTSRPTRDLALAARATPSRGTTWVARHEPCDWAWPTTRWEPGLIYRDRYPLRPPVDVQRFAGIPALVTMTGYGSLGISVDVMDDDRVIASSAVVRTIVLDPPIPIRIVILGVVLGSALAAAVVVRRRRMAHRGA